MYFYAIEALALLASATARPSWKTLRWQPTVLLVITTVALGFWEAGGLWGLLVKVPYSWRTPRWRLYRSGRIPRNFLEQTLGVGPADLGRWLLAQGIPLAVIMVTLAILLVSSPVNRRVLILLAVPFAMDSVTYACSLVNLRLPEALSSVVATLPLLLVLLAAIALSATAWRSPEAGAKPQARDSWPTASGVRLRSSSVWGGAGMTAPGDETPAGAPGRLRASHADRDRVIDDLKAAFVQGCLDQDELGHRVGQALAARTYADLAALTADLPAGLVAAQPPRPARKRVSRRAVMVTSWGTAAAVGLLVAERIMPDSTPSAILLPLFVLTLVLVSAAPTGWLLILHAWLENRASSTAAAAVPPGPSGPTPQRVTQASPPRQLPHTDRDPGVTAEEAPRKPGPTRLQIAMAH